MTMTFSGDGTITGLTAGGLPNATVQAADLASGAARTNFGAGAVLQVVSASQGTSNSSTSSSSWSDVLATATITPSSSSSKILVLANGWAGCTRNGDQLYVAGRIVRRIGGSDTIITPSNQQQGTSDWYIHYRYTPNVATSVIQHRMVLNQLDSPSTTSAITYVWQHNAQGSVATNQTSGVEIILMEIAA